MPSLKCSAHRLFDGLKAVGATTACTLGKHRRVGGLKNLSKVLDDFATFHRCLSGLKNSVIPRPALPFNDHPLDGLKNHGVHSWDHVDVYRLFGGLKISAQKRTLSSSFNRH